MASPFTAQSNRPFLTDPQGWSHIIPFGEYPHEATGLVQVLDEDALEAILENFKTDALNEHFPGLLVDFDHGSLDAQRPTEAAGWIEPGHGARPEDVMEVREDGLWAKIRLTDLGRQAVENGRYRLVSPVWNESECQALDTEGKRVRPMRLDRVALTNDPNLKRWKLSPLSNRSGGPAAATVNTNPKGPMPLDYKSKLTELLGLPAEATDDDIIKKCDEVMKNASIVATEAEAAKKAKAENDGKIIKMESDMANKCVETEKLTNRVVALEKENSELLGSVVERDLIEFSEVISDAPAMRQRLMANRADTRAFLLSIKKPAPVTPPKPGDKRDPLYNRNTAGQPKPVDQSGQGDPKAKEIAEKVANRTKQVMANRRMPYPQAFRVAKAEILKEEGGQK